MSDYEFSVPVIVVGGGACGAVAALAAHDAGAGVIVIERDERPMGTSAMSQGVFCAAGSRFQRAAGIDDSAEIFFDDIMTKTRGSADPVIARMLAEQSAPTLEWLCDSHGFPWELNRQFRAAYGSTRDRVHGWAGHAGEDMMQWLHRRLSDMGIDVLCRTRLTDIHVDASGRICGVELDGADGERIAIGCEALVLACGGFGANRAMTSRFMPETANLRYNGHEGSTGDGIVLGEKLGALLGDMGSYQGYAMLSEPGGISVPPNVLIEGGFIVNNRGQRFTDEAEDIAGMVLPLSRQPDATGRVIFDAQIAEMCSHIPEMQALSSLGLVKQWNSLADLAEGTSLALSQLEAAFADIRKAAEGGRRDSFGRSWEGARVPEGRLCSVTVTGALYHTQGGLCIDAYARVMRQDDTPFPNLFAGGGTARAVSGPSYWGYLPAMGLTTAIVGGCVAGREAGQVAAGAVAG